MRILFDIYHPAQVHLFKNLILYFRKCGHDVVVVTKDKDLTNVLLDKLGIPYLCISGTRGSLLKMAFELILRSWKLLRLHSKKPFDLALGSSVSIGHLTAVYGVESINFCEDDDSVVPLYAWMAYPFVSSIVNPRGLECKRFKRKRIFHDSYQKLAYLHPNNFTPDPEVPRKYDLEPKAYTVIRSSAYTAYHDVGQSGFSEEFLVSVKEQLGQERIVLSVENQKSHDIDPADMHAILASARLVICDSQSMAVEASILGVPNLRMSSFVGKIAVLNELENVYKLTYGFRPDEGDRLLQKLKEMQAQEDLLEEWQRRRAVMLSEKIDLNQWMIELVESRLEQIKIHPPIVSDRIPEHQK